MCTFIRDIFLNIQLNLKQINKTYILERNRKNIDSEKKDRKFFWLEEIIE